MGEHRRPDYGRIAQLERELGLASEKPILRPEPVCLIKGCDGPTDEIRSWSGYLIARLHQHETTVQ